MNEQKTEKLRELREQVMVMINMAASEVGGLTQAECDLWWDELEDSISKGFVGAVINDRSAR